MKIIPTTRRGPAAGRGARRKAQQMGTRTPAPEPGKIRESVAVLSTLPDVMGLSDLATDEGGEMSVVVDPDAPAMGEVLLKLIADPGEAEATEAVRARGERLAVLLDQREQLLDNGAAAGRLDSDLRDTDAWAGRQERDFQEELYGVIDELLDPALSPLSQTERDRLATDATEVLKAAEEEKASLLAERDRTRAMQAAGEADLQAAEDELQLVHTIRALRSEQPVDPQALDQAIATFTDLGGAPALEAAAAPAVPAGRRRSPR